MTTDQQNPTSRDASSLPAIVRAMLRPEFYPVRPDTVELIQTHISYVFIAGDFVYKLKKAVRFAFIDCTDAAQRRHLCAEEIRLNRRLAPDVYLGMYPIIHDGSEWTLGEHPGEHPSAADYVVKMRRLPADRTLDRMLPRGEVDLASIRAIAGVVVDFFSGASSVNATKYASAARIWDLILSELQQAEALVGATLDAVQYATIEKFCRGFITAQWTLLNARAEAGRIRELHGDLRCEHICLEGGKISIFDCVEFSERLRTCDIASEVAFLAMDLDRFGRPDFADELVGAISEALHDDELPRLIPFYKCFRAIIRGVVETLRSRQKEIGDAQRESALALARQYFTLAQSYAHDSAPAIIVVCGLSGTGKSTLARALHHRFGFPIVSSDRTRKKLASIPAERHGDDAYKAGIYADEVTASTYTTMLDEARRLLREASGVILDGTYQDPSHRKEVLEVAAHAKVPILFIECRAEDSEVRRRLIEREKKGNNPSDATVAVYLRQRADFVELKEIAPASHLTVETARPFDDLVSEAKSVMAKLRDQS